MYWILFLNQNGDRVKIQMDNYIAWKKRVNKMMRSKNIVYVGSGKEG